MELQETLACLRKEHGLSQAELAEELGVTRQAVSRWETGAASPTTDNLIWLSELFGVTIDELVKGVDIAPEGMPPPATWDAPEAGTDRPNKMIVFSICTACYCCAVLIWGKCTDSILTAKIHLFFVLVMIIFAWLLHGIHIIFIHYKKG